MADDDLEALRKARLEQLRQQGGGSNGPGGQGQDEAQKAKDREAEMRQTLLSQILTPEAADRLGRIRLVKEERATNVENRLIMLAQSGRLQGRVTEDVLKQILGAVSEGEEAQHKGTVNVVRRKGGWDDDDLEDLLEDT